MLGKSAVAAAFVGMLAVFGGVDAKKKGPRTALLVVDVQNCFLPGGSLAVDFSQEIIPIINKIMNKCDFDLIVGTQDWHPANHVSFYTEHPPHKAFDNIEITYRDVTMNQTLWPPHCIINSDSAKFSKDLHTYKYDYVVRKGYNPAIDSYSGFADNGNTHYTEMDQILARHNINRTVIVGLATDFCVKFTSIDSSKFNYETFVIQNAVRAVLGAPGTTAAFSEMQSWGVGVKSIYDKWFKDLCPNYWKK